MSDRLTKHGVRWRFRGFPIYADEWPYERIGITTEDEWKWSDLTDEERVRIEHEAVDLVTQSTTRTPGDPIGGDFAFGVMLDQYGVACPHHWVYVDDPRGVPFMRECPICMVSQPMPGSVYKVGDGWMRLPDPPPRIVRVPVAPDPRSWINASDAEDVRVSMKVREYQWVGERYEEVP